MAACTGFGIFLCAGKARDDEWCLLFPTISMETQGHLSVVTTPDATHATLADGATGVGTSCETWADFLPKIPESPTALEWLPRLHAP